MQEMGKNPKEAMAKYGNNPEFREIMMEFSQLMGGHFTDVAQQKKEEEQKKQQEEEKKRKELEEQMKNDPVHQIIQTDEKVREYLEDPEVKKILDHLRF